MKERIVIFFSGIIMALLGTIYPDWYHEFTLRSFRVAVKDLTDDEIIMLIRSDI